MDFKFTEEQQMLQTAVRDFLKKECSLHQVRQIEENGNKEFLPIYRKMGQLGFLGLTMPEEYGGTAGSWTDGSILNEEAGRVLLPIVHISSIVLAGHAILAFGNDDQKNRLLPKFVQGEEVITPAWLGVGMDTRSPDPAINIRKVNNSFSLNGRRRFVEFTDIADSLLVIAPYEENGSDNGHIGLALVDSTEKGISRRTMLSQSGETVADLDFRDVPVDEKNFMVGDWSQWLELVDGAKVALAAYCVGAAEAALNMGVEYAKERIQFDKPIGSFQAIQFKLADAATSLEKAKSMTNYSTWLKASAKTCTEEAAMARLLAGQALDQVATTATLVHGAYGFSVDHDMQLYFRCAKCLKNLWESAEEQKGIIAALSEI